MDITSFMLGRATADGNVQPTLQAKTATPSTSTQEIEADQNYDGLSKVTVNPIPSQYIIPTGTKNITQNGTGIDVTSYAAVDVAVQGGGTTEAEKKDVNFIDYDGTIVYSYTAADFANLSAMPANPSHTGLTAQGWNWTLSDAKTYVASNGKLWIGQMYITASGKTEIDIVLDDPELLTPYLKICVNGTVTVDWGDGSPLSTVTGTSLTTKKYASHTYAAVGKYTVSIGVSEGSFTFYDNYIFSYTNSTNDVSRRYNLSVVAVRLGTGITSLGFQAFGSCYCMEQITIHKDVTTFGDGCLTACFSLKSLTLPSNTASFGTGVAASNHSLERVSLPSGITGLIMNAFLNCEELEDISIPSTVTKLETSSLSYCYKLKNLTIPSGVTAISAQALRYCYSLYNLVFKPADPPAVANSNAFGGLSGSCVIWIPYANLAGYLSAQNYPLKANYPYMGYATFSNGETLPTQDSTQAYNVTWYATKTDARTQENAITQGNGQEVYCRYTAV